MDTRGDELLALDDALQVLEAEGPDVCPIGQASILRGTEPGGRSRSPGHPPSHGRSSVGLCPGLAVRQAGAVGPFWPVRQEFWKTVAHSVRQRGIEW